jgi:hypothetical protein
VSCRQETYLEVLAFVGHEEGEVLLVDHVLGGEDAHAAHVLGQQRQLTRAVLPSAAGAQVTTV